MEPQLTLRAALTGAALGAVLVPCNVYSGLKIGFSFNMSIAAALVAAAFWATLHRVLGPGRAPAFGLLENTVNQTAASSAASIISAGLVAPIPALTLLTGQTLDWGVMSVWLLVVSLLGVLVGLSIRRQALVVQGLPFPTGVATAETVREIYAEGREARRRTAYLLGAGSVAGAIKLFGEFVASLPQLGPALGLGLSGFPWLTTRALGFAIDPSLLLVGSGAIVGLRVGASALLGACVAWGVLTPWLFAQGILVAPVEAAEVSVYATAIEFLLWPGAALMVAAALTSFALTLPGLVRGIRGGAAANDGPGAPGSERTASLPRADAEGDVPWRVLGLGFALVTAAAVVAQAAIFDVHPAMGLLAVAVTFALAMVAAQCSGETGIPPIGALGKVTQLTFGLIQPTSVATNLMTANVTGGAAGQCSDLLHDLRAGQLLGASVRAQGVAQVIGVITGSLAGSAAYLLLIPDPAGMLLTADWPAPAVATWKAVAELFRDGVQAAPAGALEASAVAASVGIALAAVERSLPERLRVRCPSAVSMGLAFVIPAFNSISLFLGALLAAVAARWAPSWASRSALPVAAGLVAGESLAGVATAALVMTRGG